jgi:hypothetical protein
VNVAFRSRRRAAGRLECAVDASFDPLGGSIARSGASNLHI